MAAGSLLEWPYKGDKYRNPRLVNCVKIRKFWHEDRTLL